MNSKALDGRSADARSADGKSAGRKKMVFVVDDHPIVRQGLALLINQEPDLAVCGAAEEMQSALAAIHAVRPDILIVDISLNGPDGLELLLSLIHICAGSRKLR